MLIGSHSQSRAEQRRIDTIERIPIAIGIEKAETLKSKPSQIEKKASRYFLKKDSQSILPVGRQAYEIDKDKVKDAERYDGFMVIATNKKELKAEEALDKYKDLYRIEMSFRTFKSYLETRPMYHWTDKRIQGHLCMCYISFCLLNYLQQKLESGNIKFSEDKIRRTLSKMQLSLLEQDGNQFYLRSAIDERSKKILSILNLPLLNDIIPESSISKYF